MTAPARPVPDLAAAEAVAVLMTEVSEGTLTAATMTERAVQRCREVFGQCDGPTDPLWPVHVEVCRAVLGHAGLPASEVAQWLSVARSRENPGGAMNDAAAAVSALSGPHSLGNGESGGATEAGSEPVGAELDTVDNLDDDDFGDVPDDVLDEAEAASMAVIDRYRRECEGSE